MKIKRTNKFKVGLFVVAGFMLAAGALIWLGANKFFKFQKKYATYFSESISGLEIGSPVKFRGVTLGSIVKTSIAGDGYTIEVLFELDPRFNVSDDMRVKLKTSGITGMKLLEIDKVAARAAIVHPELSFKPEYPVIMSAPGDVEELREAVQDIYTRFTELDLGGISEKTKLTLDSYRKLAEDERLGKLLTSLEKTGGILERIISEKKLSELVENSGKTIENLNSVTSKLKGDLEASNLPRLVNETTQLVHSLRMAMQKSEVNIEDSLSNLQRAARNLLEITESFRKGAGAALLSGPPKRREE